MLGDLLPWLLSRIDAAKRTTADNVGGLLKNPAAQTEVLLDQAANSLQEQFGPQRQGESKRDYAQRMAASAGGLLGAIKVFHGSPYTFSKFDMSKIGTGEGAQAYGHGLYMAEKPGVAEVYKEALSKPEVADKAGNVIHKTQEFTGIRTPEQNAANLLTYAVAAQSSAPYRLARDMARRTDDEAMHKATIAVLDKWQELGAVPRAGGNLYETSLRWPDAAREARDPLGPQHFLQWDKPLSEQPEFIKKTPAMQKLLAEESAYKARYPSGGLGERLGANVLTTVKEKTLAEQGIPGIRYLDAGSRGLMGNVTKMGDNWFIAGSSKPYPTKLAAENAAEEVGQRTYNYVVFNPDLIEILKRNGQPIGGLLNP